MPQTSKSNYMRVQLIAKKSSAMTGTGRYATNLQHSLMGVGVDAFNTFPSLPPILNRSFERLKVVGPDAQSFFGSYPLRIATEPADLLHITTQTMATLLLLQRFSTPVVVTVLDIIPYLLRLQSNYKDSTHFVDQQFYRMALKGLGRANKIIAISEFTKRCLIDHLYIPEDKIDVIYLGVDHTVFYPREVPESFRRKYGLKEQDHYILFVGSDDPRKNLQVVIRVLGKIHSKQGTLKLIKVGSEGNIHQRNVLEHQIRQYGVEDRMILVDSVPDADLPLFYNVADVFVMPSLNEGFGLPVLEAMACGTPVVCANNTSLPEVAGNAALLVNSRCENEVAKAIQIILDDPIKSEQLRQLGTAQAAQFSWQRTALHTKNVYSKIL